LSDGTLLASLMDVWREPRLWAVGLVALSSGIVRGFSGFGGALIFIPILGALLGPKSAVPLFYMSDMFTASPWGLRNVVKCQWRELVPLIAGTLVCLPLGARALASVDPTTLRWITAFLVFGMLALLGSGWRYPKPPTPGVSLAVGGTAGFMGGATGITGPLVITYWLGSPASAALVRVNIMVFYAIVSLSMDVVFFLHGFFTWQTVAYAIVAGPSYGLGLIAGARIFRGASDRHYRKAALILIGISSLISLPIFDHILN
jgi:uncharacterized membrane protein YfcA